MNLILLSTYVAPIIGLTTILIGIGAMLKPQQMSGNFGIASTGSANPYIVSVGIRDIFMGLTVLILFFTNSWYELALVMFAIGLVAVSDFVVVRNHGDKKKSLVHLAGAFAVIVYGTCLMILAK